ncbi:hypothetical protein E3U43_011529 [Larimichthys crocea]|uniref:Uncharacterized protein n=1 Tax=Larimichthys crocea TaxID=215358 RepID=A0ACD3QJP0_LARCR|nr:hypothetical protein E3U43_011529 [Larimichthys crocea]
MRSSVVLVTPNFRENRGGRRGGREQRHFISWPFAVGGTPRVGSGRGGPGGR